MTLMNSILQWATRNLDFMVAVTSALALISSVFSFVQARRKLKETREKLAAEMAKLPVVSNELNRALSQNIRANSAEATTISQSQRVCEQTSGQTEVLTPPGQRAATADKFQDRHTQVRIGVPRAALGGTPR